MTAEPRTCQNCQSQFIIEPDHFTFYEKIKVPPPKDCPDCRQERRMLFRNFKTLYKRTSDKSGQSIVAMYAPNSRYKIYESAEWWSDDHDPFAFGRDFDFSRPFFDQLQELLLDVPRFALMNTRSERCEYSNMTYGSKNCYLVFGCVDDEDCAYGHIVWESKDSFDNLYVHKSERCYECVDCLGSYKLFYSQECEDCVESIGLFDCKGCTNCIGCVGLRRKNYHIFNQQVGKEEYEKFLTEHPIHEPATVALILKKQEELRKDFPHKYLYGSHNENVSGNHIYHAKNMQYAFDVKGGENASFIFTGRNIVDSADISFTIDLELGYQVLTSGKSNRMFFCHLCNNCSDAYYSDCCFNAHNIFGCAGLKAGEYVIFNKQYSKEEYEALKEKIIAHMKKTGEWGEFFPKDMTPFGYNESIAQEYAPLTKEQTLLKGFKWRDDIPATSGQETLLPENLPSDPREFTAELAKETLKCAACSRNYRLIPQEIAFYKSMGLALPRKCFNCRHARRMQSRTARRLWPGKCANCQAEFLTSFSPEEQKTFKIYCEACYQAEVA